MPLTAMGSGGLIGLPNVPAPRKAKRAGAPLPMPGFGAVGVVDGGVLDPDELLVGSVVAGAVVVTLVVGAVSQEQKEGELGSGAETGTSLGGTGVQQTPGGKTGALVSHASSVQSQASISTLVSSVLATG